MKKMNLNLAIVLAAISMIVFVGCKDDDVSTKCTDCGGDTLKPELEDVDYIFKHTVTLPSDTNNTYRNVSVQLDTDSLLLQFGYSSIEELTASFGTVDAGAQIDNEVKFFAKSGSTKFDYLEAYTANGMGYWFDANGDITTWGAEEGPTQGTLYAEFNAETMSLAIGQYPKRIAPGDTYKLYIMMSNDDFRVAFIFNITVGPQYVEETPELEIVTTNQLSLDVVPDNNYAPTDVTFDFAAAATAIGVTDSELSADLTVYGISSDGESTSQYTADAGYWYTKTGDVTSWGSEGVVVYVNYEEGVFHIGQYPDAAVPGESYVVKIGLAHNASLKMVVYEITVTVTGYVDPETPLEGDPVTLEKTYDLTQTYTGTWDSNSTQDVKDVLREAFKKTTYQIGQAIESGELVFYGLNADGSVYVDAEGDSVSTANHPGHWFSKEGNVTVWGDATNIPEVYSELRHTNETLEFGIGNHPDNAKAGDTVTFKQVAELNGGKVTFTFNLTIQ